MARISMSLSAFNWRPMETPPDLHEEVFVWYGRSIHRGQWYGGYLYLPMTERPLRIKGKAMGWAPCLVDVTAEDVRPYA